MNRFRAGKTLCLCPEGGRRQVFLLPVLWVGVGQLWSGPSSFLLTHGGRCHPFPGQKERGLIYIPTILPADRMYWWKKWILFLLSMLRRGCQSMAESRLGSNAGPPGGCPFPSPGPCSGCLPKMLRPSETPSWRPWSPQASWAPADLFLEVTCPAVNIYTHENLFIIFPHSSSVSPCEVLVPKLIITKPRSFSLSTRLSLCSSLGKLSMS